MSKRATANIYLEPDEKHILTIDTYRVVIKKGKKRYLKIMYEDMSRPHYEEVTKIEKQKVYRGCISYQIYTSPNCCIHHIEGNPVMPEESGSMASPHLALRLKLIR